MKNYLMETPLLFHDFMTALKTVSISDKFWMY